MSLDNMGVGDKGIVESLLSYWKLDAERDEKSLVIPDGCRDLIFKICPGKRPIWFLSDLEDSTYQVPIAKGDRFRGYRLKPGTNVQDQQLLQSLNGLWDDSKAMPALSGDDISSRLEAFTGLKRELDQALSCLASGVLNVDQAAKLLGVSVRTLHRHIRKETGKPPLFWIRLARIRKTGRALKCSRSLAEISYDYGFSDQAHMSREFQKWLSISPSALRLGGVQGKQLLELGYD
ncbi:helix-turn-helix domain-containing protein [Kiloniella antarctica]|uniref:Helix-turn-helix domain-containing protein n=1 Tax=Kiloniella antarctica TaxID=1550907 RepID=A0ABW5BJI3_9PROT